MFNNLKVGQKLILAFGLLIVSIVVLVVINIAGLKKVNNYQKVLDSSLNAKYYLLETKSSLFTFLFDDTITESDRQKAFEASKESSKSFSKSIEDINQLVKDKKLSESIETLKSAFNEYDLLTNQIGSLKTKVGVNYDFGTFITIREAGRSIEKLLKEDQTATLLLLQLRRNEKDFELTKNTSHIEKHNKNAIKLLKHLSEAGNNEATTELNKYIDVFKSAVTDITQVNKLVSDATAIANTKIKSNLDSIIEIIDGTKDKSGIVDLTNRAVYITSILTSTSTIVIVLIVCIWLISSIVPPIIILRNSLIKVAEGDYSQDIIPLKTKDEISDLTNAAIQMSFKTRDLLEKVINSSAHVASSSQELSATADETGKRGSNGCRSNPRSSNWCTRYCQEFRTS